MMWEYTPIETIDIFLQIKIYQPYTKKVWDPRLILTDPRCKHVLINNWL